jgi:hypothetical protein
MIARKAYQCRPLDKVDRAEDDARSYEFERLEQEGCNVCYCLYI